MIRMSKETDYGIILLAHFAGDKERLTHSARALAAETYLPLPMVSKILKILAREGFLVSYRGVKGGYSLARPPERVPIAEIITAMEGPVAMTECVEAPGECRHEPVCQLRSNWQKINEVVLLALGSITLSDLIGPLPDQLAPFGGKPENLVRLQ
ncbi:SUF system Fe-S cluster assembly regulator [Acidobacteria bacterium AH-259-A15]|nr:SUF system Fe-S cluster assembly regulator [Acidobacteria bacterium AH-259-A15]